MFSLFPKGKNAPCTTCSITNIVVGVFAVISSLAAISGVWMSHFLPEGLTFGTTQGSLALLALAVNLILVKKVGECCGCNCSIKK